MLRVKVEANDNIISTPSINIILEGDCVLNIQKVGDKIHIYKYSPNKGDDVQINIEPGGGINVIHIS